MKNIVKNIKIIITEIVNYIKLLSTTNYYLQNLIHVLYIIYLFQVCFINYSLLIN